MLWRLISFLVCSVLGKNFVKFLLLWLFLAGGVRHYQVGACKEGPLVTLPSFISVTYFFEK